MRWSQLHIPTLREDPADADAASHRLLVRAGFIRQLMAGHYSLLPLGVRVRAKVMAVIRAEMNAIGAQEFLQPTMHPAQIWERSGRLSVMGDEMFRLTDRKGADLVLGMTHEEIFTTLALELSSYRELPQLWYQVQTKFRDEPRPKSGLIRVREFTMKDSYSFDIDEAGLDKSFEAHRAAYERIFDRLGIPAIAVEASNGTMGGNDSIEFMCPSDAGEDVVATCPNCDYAANLEKATSQLTAVEDEPGPDAPVRLGHAGRAHDRGPRRAARHRRRPADQDAGPGHQGPADPRLAARRSSAGWTRSSSTRRAPPTSGPAQPEEILAALGASPGSLGAVGVTSLPVIADLALTGRRDMTTGANTDDVHLTGVDVGRDIAVGSWADLREVVGRRAMPPVRHAAAVRPGDRGRSHLQAGPQVHRRRSACRCSDRTGRRSSRSWAATASASSARWRRSPRSITTTRASSGRSRWRPAEVDVIMVPGEGRGSAAGGGVDLR